MNSPDNCKSKSMEVNIRAILCAKQRSSKVNHTYDRVTTINAYISFAIKNTATNSLLQLCQHVLKMETETAISSTEAYIYSDFFAENNQRFAKDANSLSIIYKYIFSLWYIQALLKRNQILCCGLCIG